MNKASQMNSTNTIHPIKPKTIVTLNRKNTDLKPSISHNRAMTFIICINWKSLPPILKSNPKNGK
jgi:hypothetical protein